MGWVVPLLQFWVVPLLQFWVVPLLQFWVVPLLRFWVSLPGTCCCTPVGWDSCCLGISC